MAINKKLIHFKNKENFDREVANGNILDSSIIFIQDSKEINTHGTTYKTVNWSVLEPLLFPMYLKTNQGSGNYRTRAADKRSLALVEFFNAHKDSTSTTYSIFLDLEPLGCVLYIDELLVTSLTQVSDSMISLNIPSLEGTWYNHLYTDGTIMISED